jgi:TonB-dependent SusC/RagA subfamily outer membrane receptor
MRWRIVCITLMVTAAGTLTAQSEPHRQLPNDSSDTRVTLTVQDVPAHNAIQEVARQAHMRVTYGDSTAALTKHITLRLHNATLVDALSAIAHETGLVVGVTPDGSTIYVRQQKPSSAARDVQRTSVITGRVIDSTSRQGIPSVVVTVVGTTLRTLTQDNGMFRIPNVPEGSHMLSSKALGYQTRTVSMTTEDEQPVILVLHQTSLTLSEVVTTATGTQRRVQVANDIATINADSLMQVAPVRSVTDLLASAHVPGVEVTPSSGLPGAPKRIRLRGVGSLSQSNDPVVIVDGIWINAATSTSDVVNRAGEQLSKHGGGGGVTSSYVPSRLDDIDPASIESIEILRGPSAAALYGTDAANGVIVITTKHGQSGKTRWTVDVSHDWNDVPGQYQPVYQGYGTGLFSYVNQTCSIQDVFNLICAQDSVSTINTSNLPLLTNEASGHTNSYSVGVSGGAPTIQYSVTASERDEFGPTRLPIVDAIRLRRLNQSLPGWLLHPNRQTNMTLSTMLTMQPTPSVDMAFTILGTQSDNLQANNRFSNANGITSLSGLLDTLTFADPSATYQRMKQTSTATTGVLGATVNWRPLSWLTPSLTAGIERTARNDDASFTTQSCMHAACGLPTASIAQTRAQQSVYTAGLRTSFPVTLGAWERFLSIKPSLGLNLRKNLASAVTGVGDSLALGSNDIGTAAYPSLTRIDDNSATGGWYAEVVTGIWQRFYTTFALRQDIGSALSRQIHPPTYPKFGTSWLVSDEPFFPKNSLVTTLRFRLAYGQSAVQPDITALEGRYVTSEAAINGQLLPSIVLTSLGNYRLKPERAVELEYGLDAGLFNERTQLSLTIATKHNRNELVTNLLGPSVCNQCGYTENVARVFNRSIEFSVDSRLIERNGVLWTGRIGMSKLFNRVDRVGDALLQSGISDVTRIVEGYPIDGFWQRPVIAYNDVNGDGILQPGEVVIGDTAIYVGWSNPKYSVTYSTSLSVLDRRLTFTSDFAYDGQYTQNQEIYDGWGSQDFSAPLSEQLKARIINAYGVGQLGNLQTISSFRFSAASATFTLPDAWSHLVKASYAQLTLQGSNLGLWTHYRGRDPGVNSSPIGESLSDDGTTIPQPRKYAISVRLNY